MRSDVPVRCLHRYASRHRSIAGRPAIPRALCPVRHPQQNCSLPLPFQQRSTSRSRVCRSRADRGGRCPIPNRLRSEPGSGYVSAVKNKSELLLEGYLRNHGYADVDFEPEIQGTSRRPDYRLRSTGVEILLEVKEFRAETHDFRTGFDVFDPYPPLREKINAARNKFKDLKQHCCCLVLYNVDKPLILLDWKHIYGAMLGNLAPYAHRLHQPSLVLTANQIDAPSALVIPYPTPSAAAKKRSSRRHGFAHGGSEQTRSCYPPPARPPQAAAPREVPATPCPRSRG